MSLREDISYSIWCDFIERDFLQNEFGKLLENGIIYGATSNPAIFASSISKSTAYEQQISMLQHNEAKKIYEEIAITDIKAAAAILKPYYDKNSDDGFISIEVDPTLCNDMMGTIEEGARLYNQIGYDNVMIKIPATTAGYGAMKELTAMGINVNATLIFSPSQAKQCAVALDDGIKQSSRDTKAVISVFVSRFDRLLDNKLSVLELQKAKFGIVNATKCYYEVEKFNNKSIRTLFASTGVKGDDLPKSYYINELIFPNSINTAPLDTIKAWQEDGKIEQSKILSEDECDKYFLEVSNKNIDIDYAYNSLLKDGLDAFKVSFQELLDKLKN